MDKVHQVLSLNCTGPNPACRKAAKEGRKVHVIPALPKEPGNEPYLVMPTYHYATEAEGEAAIQAAIMIEARTVKNDEDLYAYRAAQRPHYLPVGWVDPSRR